MTPFELTAILVTLVAVVGWLNVKTLHMPHGAAMLCLDIVVALLLVVLRGTAYGGVFVENFIGTVSRINISFLQTAQDVDILTTRLHAGPSSNMQFFLADITNASRAGNVVPVLWDFVPGREQLFPVA